MQVLIWAIRDNSELIDPTDYVMFETGRYRNPGSIRKINRLELVKPRGRDWATLLQATAIRKVSLLSATILE